MEKKIKITVIVAAYNIEQYIARCIESILSQTYQNLEIILIDDGSVDETGEIIDRYAQMDSRIIPVHQENAGLVAVREKGINMATGQYVGFVDGDDEIEKDMYERLLANALKYNAEISQCGILTCFYDGRKEKLHGTGIVYEFNREEGYRELMRGTLMEPSLCNKIYRREVLHNSCLNKDIVNNEDFLRNSVAFSRVNKSVFEDFCGYYYWRRFGSISNNANVVKNCKGIISARKIVMDCATENMWKYAFEGYVSAVIGTYNAMIGRQDKSAICLKKECKENLIVNKSNFVYLSKRLYIRVNGILYFTLIYDFTHVVYNFVNKFIMNKREKSR